MPDKNNALAQIKQQGVLPLYFHTDEQVSVDVLKTLYRAGIRAVEYTNRGGQALGNFKAMKKLCEQELEGMLLGIGTIKTIEEANAYIGAGADFVICPGILPEVGDFVHQADLLWIPGCMTPTEIIVAEHANASLVKLFPGNLLGPGFLSAVKELFPAMQFMPTGGVELDKDNIAAWYKAGVSAVGMGSKLVSKDLMNDKNYDLLYERTTQALALVQSIIQT